MPIGVGVPLCTAHIIAKKTTIWAVVGIDTDDQILARDTRIADAGAPHHPDLSRSRRIHTLTLNDVFASATVVLLVSSCARRSSNRAAVP
jgi:hypothetical protein